MSQPDWLITAPDPALRIKCKLVEDFSPLQATKEYLEEKAQFVRDNNHYGISAPQFGVEVRLFYINEDRFPCGGWFVNPFITKREGKKAKRESCLSLESNHRVVRADKIHAEWQDIYGKHHKGKFHGMLSRVFQHELDHLNGIMIDKK